MPPLEAGRALDALIAQKVMGWTADLIVKSPWEAFEEWRDEKGWRYGPDPKPYSTDIVAAWQVVEKLRLWLLPADGNEWCAGKMDPDSHLAPYIDTVGGRVDGAFDYIECAPAASLAICRAALAHVRGL